ncbi:MAG TPA: response regulator [Holophagaceae bacterium]|nr:response regulator [Holophagaceae bacterium]
MTQRVLMAEDIAINRRIQQAQLEPMGVEVVPVLNGTQALEACRKGEIDLAMLDLVMPGMDGFAACQALRADEATARLPILILTALAGDAKSRSLTAGADDFLRKPANSLLLQRRVTNLLELGAFERGWKGPLPAPRGEVWVVSPAAHVRAMVVAQVRESGGGREFESLEGLLPLLASESPAMVALDWALGPASLRDFAMRMQSSPALSCTPMLLLHPQAGLPIIEANPPVVDDFLELPFQAADLKQRVGLILRLSRARRASL